MSLELKPWMLVVIGVVVIGILAGLYLHYTKPQVTGMTPEEQIKWFSEHYGTQPAPPGAQPAQPAPQPPSPPR